MAAGPPNTAHIASTDPRPINGPTASYIATHLNHGKVTSLLTQQGLVNGYHRVFTISAVLLLAASIACFSLIESSAKTAAAAESPAPVT